MQAFTPLSGNEGAEKDEGRSLLHRQVPSSCLPAISSGREFDVRTDGIQRLLAKLTRQELIVVAGGKDSTLVVTALQLMSAGSQVPEGLKARLLAELGTDSTTAIQVACLVTFVPAGGAASFKAHPLSVIQQQAAALGLPHVIKEITGPKYLDSYQDAMRALTLEQAVDALATGDILDVCDNFMGRAAADANMKLLRPLWGIPRPELLEYVWELGLQPMITCIHASKFQHNGNVRPKDSSTNDRTVCVARQNGQPPSNDHNAITLEGAMGDVVQQLLGQCLTRELHQKVLLPACQAYGVDECGEWGEYHTMVLDGPTFKSRVVVRYEGRGGDGDDKSDYVFVRPSSVVLEAK